MVTSLPADSTVLEVSETPAGNSIRMGASTPLSSASPTEMGLAKRMTIWPASISMCSSSGRSGTVTWP